MSTARPVLPPIDDDFKNYVKKQLLTEIVQIHEKNENADFKTDYPRLGGSFRNFAGFADYCKTHDLLLVLTKTGQLSQITNTTKPPITYYDGKTLFLEKLEYQVPEPSQSFIEDLHADYLKQLQRKNKLLRLIANLVKNNPEANFPVLFEQKTPQSYTALLAFCAASNLSLILSDKGKLLKITNISQTNTFYDAEEYSAEEKMDVQPTETTTRKRKAPNLLEQPDAKRAKTSSRYSFVNPVLDSQSDEYHSTQQKKLTSSFNMDETPKIRSTT